VPQDIESFQLPTPACPSPPVATPVPAIGVAVGGADAIVAMPGASTLQTCSTVATNDAAADDPRVGVTAHAGERLTVSVPAGWSILACEAFDRPAAREGANVTPLVVLPAPSANIELPRPPRSGRSIVGVVLAIVSATGQVVGRVEGRFQVEVD
jgi:hypothetical protein